MHVGPKIDPLKEKQSKSLRLLVLGIFEHVTIVLGMGESKTS
jgi:hypothetical protein